MGLFDKLKKKKDAAKEEKSAEKQSAVNAGPSLKNVKVPTATKEAPATEAPKATAKAFGHKCQLCKQ